jgi:hypothetical protein
VADSISFEVDNVPIVIAALGSVVPVVQPKTVAASKVSADAVADEARARVARRSGLTAAGIEVVPSFDGYGYVVRAARERMYMLPLWLEFGTKHMAKKEFLFVSARLEAPRYPPAVAEAVTEGITSVGLGPT